MSEDLAFRIQLGIILPKLKKKIAPSVSEIVEELVNILKEGTREGEDVELAPVKDMFMKDFEIFLDDAILPEIEKKINPPIEETPVAEECGEETAEEEVAVEE